MTEIHYVVTVQIKHVTKETRRAPGMITPDTIERTVDDLMTVSVSAPNEASAIDKAIRLLQTEHGGLPEAAPPNPFLNEGVPPPPAADSPVPAKRPTGRREHA